MTASAGSCSPALVSRPVAHSVKVSGAIPIPCADLGEILTNLREHLTLQPARQPARVAFSSEVRA